MKIFLAARYNRYPEMQERAAELEKLGYTVTSRWIRGEHQYPPDLPDDSPEGFAINMRFAREDVYDLLDSDLLVFFADGELAEGEIPSRGGKHTEFGMALCLELPIVIVGPRENVYHYGNGIYQYDTWEEFVDGFVYRKGVTE